MKILFILSLAATLVSLGSARAGDGKNLFILSGQSNMAGLKPEISFTPTVEGALGKEHVIVVKDAQSGCPIRRWYKKWEPAKDVPVKGRGTNGDLYDRLMAKVREAVKGQEIKTVTFVWMQGERDAREKQGEVYATSLRGLFDQLKADLKRDDIHFVIGRISDFDMDDSGYPHWTKVREAQVKVAESDPNVAWIDTDDLNGKGNGLHYGAGYAELGKRFAEKAIAMIRQSTR